MAEVSAQVSLRQNRPAADSNASGGEVASARYWPFGGLRPTTGTLPTDRLFTGQVRDLNDDRFYFFTARYYDATIGKFVQPDTIVPDPKNPQTLNRYAYGLNNPLRLNDPTGHIYDDPSDGDDDTYPATPPPEPAPTPTPPPRETPTILTATHVVRVRHSVMPSRRSSIAPAPAAPDLVTTIGTGLNTIKAAGQLATGNPAAAVFSLGGMVAGAAHNTPAKVIAAVGSYYAGQLGRTGSGLEAITRGVGAADVPGALAGAKLLGRTLPAVGGAIGVVQGAAAAGDLWYELSTGHDSRAIAHDSLVVLSGVVGGAVIVAVAVAAAPEVLTGLAIAGVGLAIASAVVRSRPASDAR